MVVEHWWLILLQIGGLKELTIHIPEEHHSLCIPWVEEWMKKHCIPCNFNLTTERVEKQVFCSTCCLTYTTNRLYFLFQVILQLLNTAKSFPFLTSVSG